MRPLRLWYEGISELRDVLAQALGLALDAQLGQGVALDLADPLAGQAQVPAHLVEGARAAVVEAEAHPDHDGGALRQAVEHAGRPARAAAPGGSTRWRRSRTCSPWRSRTSRQRAPDRGCPPGRGRAGPGHGPGNAWRARRPGAGWPRAGGAWPCRRRGRPTAG